MAELKTEHGILALVDIVDFTGQASRLDDRFTAQYTKYFNDRMGEIVSRHHYMVIKSLGDAILFFGTDPTGILDIMLDLFERDKLEDKFGFRSRFRLVAHSGYFQFQVENGRPSDLVSPEGIKVFRLEKEARAWELVVTQPLFQGLKPLLTQKNLEANRLHLKEPLKGFDNDEWFPPFYRLRLVPTVKGVSNLLEQRQDELAEDVQEIPVFGKIYPAVPMEQNFINLRLKPAERPLDFCPPATAKRDEEADDKPGRKRRRRGGGWDERLDAEGEEGQREQNLDIDVPRLYKNYYQGIIFGLPGAGKTTILRHLAFQEFKAQGTGTEKEKRLVLFVPCRDIPSFDAWRRKQNRESIEETLTDDALDYLAWVFLFGVRDYYDITPEELVQFQAAGQKVRQAFTENRLTLLLDALDEAPDQESKERIKELFTGLVAASGAGNRIFLTSRPAEHFSPGETSIPVFYVRNLDMEQVRQIARHLLAGETDVYKAFDTALWQEEVVVKMAATPITALLITAYFQAYRKFQHRFPMYDLLVKFILLKVWDNIKKDALPYKSLDYFFEAVKEPAFLTKNRDIAILYEALGSLCFDLFYDLAAGQILRSVPGETLLAYFTDFIEENRYLLGPEDPPVLAKNWLDRFHADHLLLRAGKSDYVFVHSTVMEYLAASHLVSLLKKEPEKYAGRVDRALASVALLDLETIPLAAGSDLYRGFFILARIRDFKPPYDRELLIEVAIDCLAELEWQITKSFQSILIEKLRAPTRKIIRENRPASDWLYTYLKEVVRSPDKERLRRAIGRLEPAIKLSRETFVEEYLDHEAFEAGDAEIVELRRDWLKNLVQRDLAKKWLAEHENFRLKREDIAIYDNVLQLDSDGYHPEDKNFAYYKNLIGPELLGFFGSPNLKHVGSVFSVAFSPAGNYLVSGSDDHTLRLWEFGSGKEVHAFSGHRASVNSVAFSPDGKYLVSGSDDHSLRLWEAGSGQQVRVFAGHRGRVWGVAFSPDGQYLVSGSNDGSIRLWEAGSGKEVRGFYGHEGWVLSVAFSPDGQYLASGSADYSLRLWDTASGHKVHIFSGHEGRVLSVAFSPDGKYLVSGSSDNTLRLWAAGSGQPVRAFAGQRGSVRSVAFSPDGKYLVSGSTDNSLSVWDAGSGKEVRVFSGHRDSVLSVAFSPDGKYLVSGSDDHSLRVWEAGSGQPVRVFAGHQGRVRSVAVSSDGQYLVSGSEDNSLRLWEASSGKPVRTFAGHRGSVRIVAFSPTGNYLVSGSDDNTMRLWEADSGKEVRIFAGHQHSVLSLAFSPAGNYLVSGSDDHTLRLWETGSGKQVRVFAKHHGSFYNVAFSPDGKYLVSGSDDKTMRLWAADSGKQVRIFSGHRGTVWSVAFSPDGKFLVSGSDDHSLRLWDRESGKPVRTFTGHRDSVWSVAFSPAGKHLVSGSDDQTLRIWDWASGECIHLLDLTWPVLDIKPLVTEPGIYAAACGNGTVILLDLRKHLI